MRGGAMSHPLRLGFHRVVLHDRDTGTEWIAHAARALLQDVRELVAEDLLALRRGGVVLAGCEMDVGALGECESADGRCLRTDVDADVGEARAEERLHLLANRLRNRLAAAATDHHILRQLHGGSVGVALNGGTLWRARRRERLGDGMVMAQRRLRLRRGALWLRR